MTGKAWQRRERFTRRVSTGYIRDRILILCEGEKTEPNYFRAFPVGIDLVEVDVRGAGANTLSLVEEAIRLKWKAIHRNHPYNQIWCVFDRDSFPAGNFNKAFFVAKENRIRIAYSNQCFELWYLLHYHFIDTPIDRHEYSNKLTRLTGRKYTKNDGGMYALLRDQQQTAIRNAKKLMGLYAPCDPENNDPSTTVYELVEAVNAFITDETA